MFSYDSFFIFLKELLTLKHSRSGSYVEEDYMPVPLSFSDQ